MGWLGALGKIGKAALNIGTGGIAGSVMDAFDGVGKAGAVMGAQQGGANNARVAQGQLDISRDRNALDRYSTEQGAQFQAGQQDLQRQGFEMGARGTNAKQALIGALLSGKIDPVSVKGGVSSGGLLRAMQANPEALAAMKQLNSSASTAQTTPMQFTGGNLLTAPTMSAPQKIDTGDGKMGTLTKILQVIGAFGNGGGGGE